MGSRGQICEPRLLARLAELGVKEGVVAVVISGGFISKHPILYRVFESDMASVEYERG